MRSAVRRRVRVLVGFLAVVAMIAVLVAALGRFSRNGRETFTASRATSPQNGGFVSRSPSAPGNVDAFPTPVRPTENTNPALQNPEDVSPNNLIIPVAGVRPDQLHDTFSESRSEGRVHDAIDIPAPLGTPVLAAADGRIVKLFQSERGGTTIYQLSADNKFVYYYAHLNRYAEGLAEGHFAKQGETIAYVGDSGNAGAGNYHLHFSIALISNPKDFWHGVNINPYPLLKR